MNTAVKNNPMIFVVLLYLVPLAGLGIDIFVPSLPYIQKAFLSSTTVTQLSVALYIIAYGMAQFMIGILSDAWGRRRILIVGMIIFTIVSAIIPFSHSISMLLVLRFVQGLAVGAPGVVVKATLPDCYEGKELAHKSTYTTLAWALGPIVAPFIGGYLQYWFGWHAPFYFLVIYGLVGVFVVLCCLPETNLYRHPLSIKRLRCDMWQVLSHRFFLAAVIVMGVSYSFMTIFNVAGPFLIQVVLHKSPVVFGHIALLLGLTWFLSQMGYRLIMHRVHPRHVLFVLMLVSILSSVAMLIIASAHIINMWVIVVPTMLSFVAGSVIFVVLFGKALSLFPKLAGTAAALMASMFTICAGVMSGLASLLKTATQLPLSMAYLVLGVASLFVFLVMLRKRLRAIATD